MIDEKPGDARLHTFLATFYRNIGAFPQAREQAGIARSLSPQKQSIIIEQAVVEIQSQDLPKAAEYFKEAFTLDEANTQVRVLYAATLLADKKNDEALALVEGEYFNDFVLNDFALSVANQMGNKELIARMFEVRVAAQPDNTQNRASLAFTYYELKNNAKAIEVLEKAGADIPTFATSSQCIVKNIKAGKAPDEGC
jgi:thioredoxin-like negative regulator of GroEL